MFRNAVASSSKLTLPAPLPRPHAVKVSGFSTSSRARLEFSPPRRNSQSSMPTLSTAFPELTPPTTPSTPAPSSRNSGLSPAPSTASVMPSISSSSPSRNAPSPPKFRWDPSPQIDDTITTHTLTVTSTRNNLLLTLSDRQGPLFGTITGGSDKTFKNAARSGYEAGHQASLKMFGKVVELASEAPGGRSNGLKIRLAMKGFQGQGMEAFIQALGGNEGGDVRRAIVRVEDRTGVKIGGTRARKPRRL